MQRDHQTEDETSIKAFETELNNSPSAELMDELLFQRASQTYLRAMPSRNPHAVMFLILVNTSCR
jgi:hypothetical protein